MRPCAKVRRRNANSAVVPLTFEWFGDEVCCRLVLLHVVPLHDCALLVQPQVPGPARGLLPVQHGRVGDVVVLKHRLLELALRGEVFLRAEGDARENSSKGRVSTFIHNLVALGAVIWTGLWSLRTNRTNVGQLTFAFSYSCISIATSYSLEYQPVR